MKITAQKRAGRYFIEGKTHQEVEQAHWSFYNHEATNTTRLNWIGETCGWFYSASPEQMLRGMENIALAEILNNRSAEFKGKKGGALAEAKRIAAERFAQIEEEPSRYEKEEIYRYKTVSYQPESYADIKDFFLARAFKG